MPTLRDAVAEAGRRRLRPILMTTLTTILGAGAAGASASARAPTPRRRSRAPSIGGLTASTLITLVLIPAVYTLFARGAPSKAAAAERLDARPAGA